MARIELREKNRSTLVGIEILLISILLSYWLAKKFDWDVMTGIVSGVVSLLILGVLFFGMRIFRYIFSIGFSLFWGFLAYTFADSASKSSVTPWVALAVVVLISLGLHKDYFRFESGRAS